MSCLRFLCALSISYMVASNAHACDPCGLHNSVQVPGVLNALRTTGLQPGSFTLSAQEQISSFNVRGENELRTSNNDIELIKTLSVTQASLGYNISETVAVQINAPFIIRSYDHFERYRKVRETEAGLGDMSVTGTFSPYSYTDVESRFFIAVLGGVKLPTGDSGSLKRVAHEDPATADQRIQGRGLTLGTGSCDVPIGVVSYARSGRFVSFTTAQYTIRGEGAADYRFANDVVWSESPGYLLLLGEEENMTLSVVMSGEHKGDDTLNGAKLSKTSASNIYLGPEVFYSSATQFSVQLAIDWPVSLNVGDATVEPDMRGRIGVSIYF